MDRQTLTAFWIVPRDKGVGAGLGVTAHSLADAWRILDNDGYSLPEDKSELQVIEGVQVSDLDPHVVANMGPIVVRGVWFPFSKVGV